MPDITQRIVETNGIAMNIAELGSGPLVILCHGFPESWYSWRHQMKALAEAGYHAVAPDMRGYGATESPQAIDQFSMLHLVGDIVGLVGALGETSAVVAGHDWGAPVAWHCALMRPDVFKAVVGLSVPYFPRSPAPPTSVMPQNDQARFYQLYFQEPGVAEAELEADVRSTVRRMLYGASGDNPAPPGQLAMVPRSGGILSNSPDPAVLPGWAGLDDVEVYAAQYAKSGFRGGLNWYRNIDRNWELLAAFAGAKVAVPALFMAGERDLVLAFPGVRTLVDNLKVFVPGLRTTILLPDCGHWIQQERAAEVSAAMIEFLRGL